MSHARGSATPPCKVCPCRSSQESVSPWRVQASFTAGCRPRDKDPCCVDVRDGFHSPYSLGTGEVIDRRVLRTPYFDPPWKRNPATQTIPVSKIRAPMETGGVNHWRVESITKVRRGDWGPKSRPRCPEARGTLQNCIAQWGPESLFPGTPTDQ